MRWLVIAKLKLGLWISRVRCAILGPYVTHLLIDSCNGKLLVPVADFNIGRKLAFNGAYEKQQLERISGLIDRNSKVLFVGAHIGSLAVPISRLVSEVVAVEADPNTFATLNMNLALNDCRNVRTLNLAASDANGPVSFMSARHNSGGSKIASRNRRREFVYDSPKVLKVSAARLDDALTEFTPTLIVMDIEGSEVRALKGMPRLLASAQVLMIEFLPNHIENIAGITCEEFVSMLPFGRIQLLNEPEERNIVQRVRTAYYYGGADLLCAR